MQIGQEIQALIDGIEAWTDRDEKGRVAFVVTALAGDEGISDIRALSTGVGCKKAAALYFLAANKDEVAKLILIAAGMLQDKDMAEYVLKTCREYSGNRSTPTVQQTTD